MPRTGHAHRKYKGQEDTEDPRYKKYLRHVKQFENGYPCNVRLSIGSEDMDMLELRIRHYIANEEIRDRDPAKTAKRIDGIEHPVFAAQQQQCRKNKT